MYVTYCNDVRVLKGNCLATEIQGYGVKEFWDGEIGAVLPNKHSVVSTLFLEQIHSNTL